MIPNTPKGRADDLKSIGAKVSKLPSFKRGEFVVVCPTCGKQAVDSGGVKFLSPEVVEAGKTKGYHGARVNLDDETHNRGTVWESKRSGDRMWRECRAHVLACTDGELDDEKRRAAIHAAHAIRRAVDNAPEMLPKVLAELADVLASLPHDTVLVVGPLRMLSSTMICPLPRDDATREARGVAAKENGARASAVNREMTAAFAGLLDPSGKP